MMALEAMSQWEEEEEEQRQREMMMEQQFLIRNGLFPL